MDTKRYEQTEVNLTTNSDEINDSGVVASASRSRPRSRKLYD
jgi:hypothetical protein